MKLFLPKLGEDRPNITFDSIPEIMPADLEASVNDIVNRRRGSLPSYGAFLIRNGGESIAREAIGLLQQTQPVNRKAYQDQHFKGKGTLHTDKREVNDATVTRIISGETDVVILSGTFRDIRHASTAYVSNVTGYCNQRTTRALFNGSFTVYDPLEAWRSLMQPSDVIVFDSSRPHAFRAVTRRESVSTFFIR